METTKTTTQENQSFSFSSNETTVAGDRSEAQLKLMDVSRKGIQISFMPSKRKKTKKVTINLEGEFTLINASVVFENIMPVFNEFDVVIITLKNIFSIDLAAIQCLYKIKMLQEPNGKTVSVESELTQEYRELVRISGFLPLLTNPKLTA
ncbi:MAG: hypothetical protein K0S32_1399 [Bacteroidetes bacterium]|jgi:hypothetical protein|nr:hypothetical protein [Bacteroidota bacterium]